MKQPRIAAWGFLLAGMLFLVAAVVPLTRGADVNFVFLLLAGAFVVIGTILGKQRPPNDPGPPGA